VVGELHDLVGLVRDGMPELLPGFRRFLAWQPEVWRNLFELAARAERTWAEALAAGDPLLAEGVRREAAERRQELAGEHSAGLEQVLVGYAAACWLAARDAEGALTGPGDGSPGRAASAWRRYRAAVRDLATVRRLPPGGPAPAGEVKLHRPRRRHRSQLAGGGLVADRDTPGCQNLNS
jgi:hypothetical protein